MNTVARLTQYGTIIASEFDEVSNSGVKITGFGTYYSNSFNENVGIGTTLRANVFKPFNQRDLNFCDVTNNPGNGTFMRRNNSGEVDLYNEIDEISFLPTYAIIPLKSTVNEGESIAFDVFTSNDPNTTLYYEIVSPEVITITPNSESVNEGNSVVFNIDATNISTGTTIYYSISGIGISSSDFTDNTLTGIATVSFGSTVISKTVAEDYNSPVIETEEFFDLSVRYANSSGIPYGPILATSPRIKILNTSLTATVTASPESLTEGNLVTFTISVNSNSGTLYYTIEGITGTITSADFSDGLLSGSFSYNNGTAQITKTVVSDGSSEGTESFVLKVRSGSINGTVIGTSPPISVTDPAAFSTYAQFTANAVIGSSITLLGQSGTTRTLSVVADPSGNKSIRFPVTWPSSFFSFNGQNTNYSFTMLAENFTVLSDVDYIFNGGFFGVHPISGNSENCCDPYSMSFSGISLFNIRGFYNNSYFKVSFGGNISSNSGTVNYTTDFSVNGGNGLTGASGFFYLS